MSAGSRAAALEVIQQAGGHLVLTRDKQPLWGAWQHRRPSLDVATMHDGELGLIPWSLRTTGLDVDDGDWRRCPPSKANYGTPRGGRHLYYSDRKPRRNSKWAAHGCKGDLRGGSGYLILWDDAPRHIADAILADGAFQMPFPLPLDALRPQGVELIEAPAMPAVRPVAASLDLETVPVGARNVSLFDSVRLAAYRRSRAALDLDQWLAVVRGFALEFNRRFMVPLPRDEAASVGYSVATWTWSSMADYADVEAQRRRGRRSGQVRRKRTAARDAAILDALADGRTQGDVGRTFGLSQQMVSFIRSRSYQ